MRCAVKQCDEQAHAMREDEFLRIFITEYESLHHITNAMRRRMDDICIRGVAESRKKRIYDAIYRIEVEKSRRVHIGLLKYKRCIDHVQLDVQARYKELHRRDREEEICLSCGIRRMRIHVRPL